MDVAVADVERAHVHGHRGWPAASCSPYRLAMSEAPPVPGTADMPGTAEGRDAVMTVLVGTSGWQYKDWREVLYPQDRPQRLWLEE